LSVHCSVSGSEGATTCHVRETLGEIPEHQRRQSRDYIKLLAGADGHSLPAV